MQRSQHFRMPALIKGHAVNAARRAPAFHSVDQHNPVGLLDVRQHIKKCSACLHHGNPGRKLSLREGARRVHAHALVGKKEIAKAKDQCIHGQNSGWALTTVTGLPSGRITCTAHDMHGSNECTTRNTSTGCDAFDTGVPIRACSMGPRTPLVSFGEAFQHVGVMIWYCAIDAMPLGARVVLALVLIQWPSAPRGASVKPMPALL